MTTRRRVYPFSDRDLARRLERAEANANAAFVEARAELQPESGATWTEIAGAYAMFDGVDSPLTQTFGLGLFDPVGRPEMGSIEGFFRERDAPVFHEVSPLADVALLHHLRERGYAPIEFTSVMFRPLEGEGGDATASTGHIEVRRTAPDEAEVWTRVAAEGWGSESAELGAFMLELGRITARSRRTHAFLAAIDGESVAAGALSLADGVALLAGASTIPPARNRGAQRALLEARLRFAAERGCDLAMMCAAPGSASQRNAERQGFRIAYTRIKWSADA